MDIKKINLGDLIFILFYKNRGKISGSTTLQKLIDIIRLDSGLPIDIDYLPYDYGDFSQEVNDVVQVFIDNSWIKTEEIEFQDNKIINNYLLTEIGIKIAQTIYENLLSRELEYFKVIDKFKDKTQEQIISYSYFWYPSTAIKSKIKDNIFKKYRLSDIFDGELEEEYNNLKTSGKTIKEEIRKTWRC